MIRYLLSAFILLTVSCNQKDEVKISRYFDLQQYFQKEALRLSDGNYILNKKLITGLIKEDVLMDSVNWTEILKPFESCDINKSSWKNSYSIDSTFHGDTLIVNYLAIDRNLEVHQIKIGVLTAAVNSIEIIKKKKSFYYTSEETFLYHIDGFIISSSRKVRFSDESNYQITGKFINRTS